MRVNMKTKLEPPYEINGSEIPFVGRQPVTTPIFIKA
jgi:hypothetical protein